MSEVTCPCCAATLFDSELQAGECTSCNRSLPSNWVPETTGSGGRPDSYRSWEPVRAGVDMLAAAAFILIIVLLLAGGAFLLAALADSFHFMGLIACLTGLAGLCFAVSCITGLLGFVTSLFCPRPAGLRGLVGGTIAVVLLGMGLLLCPVGEFWGEVLPWERRTLSRLMAIAGLLFLVLAQVLFFLYLRGVARRFGDPVLGGYLLIWGSVFATIAVLNLAALFLSERLLDSPLLNGVPLEILVVRGLFTEGLTLSISGTVLLRKLHQRMRPGTLKSRVWND